MHHGNTSDDPLQTHPIVLALQQEILELRKQNVKEVEILRRENDEMRSQFRHSDIGKIPTHLDIKDNDGEDRLSQQSRYDNPRHDGEGGGFNNPRRSDTQRHPFVDGIIETPLPIGWKNIFNFSQGGNIELVYLTPPNSIDLFETLMARFGHNMPQAYPIS
ncbi:hypothetical protein CR513_62759, partial [Mucuna pruriens]